LAQYAEDMDADQMISQGWIKEHKDVRIHLDHFRKSDTHGSQATIPNGKHYSHR